MSIHHVNISGNGTNSVPPTANPSNLSFQKSDSDSILFKNNTSFNVVITFSNSSVCTPSQINLSPNSSVSVSINESSEDGEYPYDIHFEGKPGPETKPLIYLSSTTILGGNPTPPPTPTEFH